MLEKFDLNNVIDKEEYQSRIGALKPRIGLLQRRARELELPVVIVFEGWSAAGKGTIMNDLILSMDPRGFNVFSTQPPTEEEILRPFLWRFWTKLPDKGRIALFDRSWYGRVLRERVEGIIKKKTVAETYSEINAFERQLSDDGAIIIKFFLHISKKEQKRRFKKLEENKATSWRITDEDWRQQEKYKQWVSCIEEMCEKTDTEHARWTIVESHDRHFASVKVFQTVAAILEEHIARATKETAKGAKTALPGPTALKAKPGILDAVDISQSLDPKEYDEKLALYQKRMWDLEHQLYRKRLPVGIVFEGCDAAGKGGAIKRLAQGLDPRGYEVVPFAAPNDLEKRHHYLWRFWIRLPKAGHITIFDRSWYGRVLVERVEGFCTEEQWRRAYDEINETEAQWTHFGMVLIKFWLHIGQDEQLRRFTERQHNAQKRWKITDEDWRNREKWPLYKNAINEMIRKTDTPKARWTIVEANSKLFARIKVLKTVIDTIEQAL